MTSTSVDVLHVPYTYFPDAVGGTEIYVAGLAESLRSQDISSAIAAPGKSDSSYLHDDFAVFRFGIEGQGLAQAYGEPDIQAAFSFRTIMERIRPRIVHLHARTAAVSESFIDVAHEAGAKVVVTYHSPSFSCARGTMMWMGSSPCDGRLERDRCTKCTLARHAVPPLLREAIIRTPQVIRELLGLSGLTGRAFTALQMPDLISRSHARFHSLMRKADRTIAVCAWVKEVLLLNGVPEAKLMLCRQGLSIHETASPLRASKLYGASKRTLRIGYFGRLDPTKGVDLLVTALRQAPETAVNLEIYGICQEGSERYTDELKRYAAGDSRINFQLPLPPGAIISEMEAFDLVAVPSRGLETGPLVVLEAFAAKTPVLGTRLGGIAELIEDGVDGVLVEPDKPDTWAHTITALAESPERVQQLRNAIRPPRTMHDVACEMTLLYQSLLADAAS